VIISSDNSICGFEYKLTIIINSEIYIENYNKYLIIIRYNHILKFYNTTTNKPILFNQIKNKENKND